MCDTGFFFKVSVTVSVTRIFRFRHLWFRFQCAQISFDNVSNIFVLVSFRFSINIIFRFRLQYRLNVFFGSTYGFGFSVITFDNVITTVFNFVFRNGYKPLFYRLEQKPKLTKPSISRYQNENRKTISHSLEFSVKR